MMKKIIYCIGLCLVLGLTSCNDFLTVSPDDKLSSDSFWRNQTDVEAALASSYGQMYLMGYSGDEWSLAEIKWPVEAFREDIIQIGNDAVNYPNWVELYNYTYTNGNSQFSSYWDTYYKGISFANQVIEKTAAIPEENLSANKKSGT